MYILMGGPLVSWNLQRKLGTVFTDVDTEGRKRGYEIAIAKYEVVYQNLKDEYLMTKKILALEKYNRSIESEHFISLLQQLEKKKQFLDDELALKKKKIPQDCLVSGLGAACFGLPILGIGIFEMIYQYKNNKLKKAEIAGYIEARKLYLKKINELKGNLDLLKKKGDAEIQKLTKVIVETCKEISDREIEIVNLELALNS